MMLGGPIAIIIETALTQVQGKRVILFITDINSNKIKTKIQRIPILLRKYDQYAYEGDVYTCGRDTSVNSDGAVFTFIDPNSIIRSEF